jgi:hypothetical protein
MNQRAKDILARALEVRADRTSGAPNALLRMVASRQMALTVADFSALPVVPGALELQAAGGEGYFMIGYSKPGGPDVIRP